VPASRQKSFLSQTTLDLWGTAPGTTIISNVKSSLEIINRPCLEFCPISLKHKEVKRQDVPNDDVAFAQVFDSSHYEEMAKGLWAANSSSYNGTAMYKQTLPVLPNANFGIQGNYIVRVLWVYNTWVGA